MAVEFKLKLNINIDNLTAFTKEYVAEALEAGGALVEAEAKRLCPVDRGHLRASIEHKVEKWNIVRVGTNQITYAAAIEFGTPPHGPPIDPKKGIEESPIGEWAKRKGIPELAWPIWWQIYHHGTQPHPYLRPAIFNNQKTITHMIKIAMIEAAQASKK